MKPDWRTRFRALDVAPRSELTGLRVGVIGGHDLPRHAILTVLELAGATFSEGSYCFYSSDVVLVGRRARTDNPRNIPELPEELILELACREPAEDGTRTSLEQITGRSFDSVPSTLPPEA